MTRPALQVALDFTALEPALAAARRLAGHVDILEAGTLLCLACGMDAVRALRRDHPDHLLVADFKAADAGETLAELAFDAGANWMTVVCAAPLATMERALAVAEARGGDVQIELFGHWTLDDARAWRRLGIRQAVFHRGRDAQAAGQTWSRDDLDRLKALSDIGLEMSVTGGIAAGDLPLFRDIAAKVFIAGRALYGATDPAAAAIGFQQAIADIWGA
ncbi:3-keto-L-gulonate-6-phosphate decarboxylase UlaD [Pleomorphomonas carboxyditropha]|uniref:3-keto-L-gulonate-6-phosphate decarboxylase n=1 Tax=Pleomorphomonas carboxyditropha TaxID=2023338 RepID=A0A2G9X1P5_9HYPH|nr:3-keto-L-gulonate-6-phosphate decarboxylase UlaD [Pleomorphomonas carboxyditropha]PIP00870.1 3-keto-L-gulonate-6-phosphate decarboxylase [Pleomorphomonas carboxyditropha]